MRILTIDFETYWSSADKYSLTKIGPIEYIRDSRFEVQLLGTRYDRGEVIVYDKDNIASFLSSVDIDDTLFVGHNINGFDSLILSEVYGIRPKHILDTQVLMRWSGHARLFGESHGVLSRELKTGTKELGTAISDGKHWDKDFSASEREEFITYCKNDVLQCSNNLYILMTFVGNNLINIIRFNSLTARMATEPKLILDRDLVLAYMVELDDAVKNSRLELQKMFKFNSDAEFLKAIRSNSKFASMLQQLDVEPPVKLSEKKTATKMQKIKDTMSPEKADELIKLGAHEVFEWSFSKLDIDFLALQEHLDPRVRLLVDIRLANNSNVLKSRAERLLNVTTNNWTLPVMLSAFKAHTGRYGAGNSGVTDGLNFQNFNKRDPKQQTLRKAIRPPKGYVLVACDSSQIECRMLAYEANEIGLLESFTNGDDPYVKLASKMFKREEQELLASFKSGNKEAKHQRTVAKVAILSAGYQVSAQKYADTLLRSGSKLDEDVSKHYELAKVAHAVYRADSSKIVAFWQKCQNVLKALHRGRNGSFGGAKGDLFVYYIDRFHGKNIPTIEMPNGYKLRYPNLRVGDVTFNGALYNANYKYDRVKSGSVIPTSIYGGSLTENVTQCLAFQLLLWQAIEMDKAGVPLVCNIHDAWISVVPEKEADNTLKTMIDIMSRTPDWLKGFPVACDGEIGHDFTIA